MTDQKSLEAAILQLKAGEALRQQAIQLLEKQLTDKPKKKGLSVSQKQRIIERFYKNHVNQ